MLRLGGPGCVWSIANSGKHPGCMVAWCLSAAQSRLPGLQGKVCGERPGPVLQLGFSVALTGQVVSDDGMEHDAGKE